jgi:hypothetical protein
VRSQRSAANAGDALSSAAEQFNNQVRMWVPGSYEALAPKPPEWTGTVSSRSALSIRSSWAIALRTDGPTRGRGG